MAIKSYYEDSPTVPMHYTRSESKYASIPLNEIFNKRGLYNKTLSSLCTQLPDGAIIAGSFVASVVCDTHKAADIDIFFTNADVFMNTYELLTNPPDGEDAWAYKNYTPDVTKEELLKRSASLRVVNFKSEDPNKPPIQLIKMVWYNDAEHVIDSFDFTVTQFAITNKHFIVNPSSLIDIFKNSLIVHRHQYPMETIYRLVKYTKKGYNVSPKTIKKLVDDIRSSTDLDPPLPFTLY